MLWGGMEHMLLDGVCTPIILCWYEAAVSSSSLPLPPGAAAPANVGSVSRFVDSCSSCFSLQTIYMPLCPIKISFLDGWLKLFILILLCSSSQTEPFDFLGLVWSFLLSSVSQYHFHWCKGQKKRNILRNIQNLHICRLGGCLGPVSPASLSWLNQLVSCYLTCFYLRQ